MSATFRPGQVDIQSLIIIPPSGNQLDILGLFTEMIIYENIFANSLSGVVTMIDTHNLITEMPITGEEWLMMKYKVRDEDEIRELTFRTYKVGDRVIDGNKQVYKIHFTTMEMYIDATMNVSRTFTGHAETIISQMIKTELGSGKTLTADTSGNLLKITTPWWSPFKIAGWTTQKAVSADKARTSDYLFYESLTGYNFKNISLAKGQEAKTTFKYNHERAVDEEYRKDASIEMSLVKDFYTPLIVDQLDRFRHDLYKTQVFAHDTTFKALNIHTYDLDKQWDEKPKLNKFRHFTKDLPSIVSPGVKLANEATYLYDSKTYDWQGLITSQRKSSVMLNEMMKVDIEVWGRMDLAPGDVVNLDIGRLIQSDTKTLDKYYSGRYLISAIHHRFAGKEYKLYLQLVKDSVKESLY